MSADEAARNREVIIQLGVLLADDFVALAGAALDSIQNGSALTGAPGQPVDTAFEKGGWQLTFPTPDLAVIGTNVAYAPVIEEGNRAEYDRGGARRPQGLPGQGAGGRHIKSTVGGAHSVKLTAANLDRLRDDIVRRRRGGPT